MDRMAVAVTVAVAIPGHSFWELVIERCATWRRRLPGTAVAAAAQAHMTVMLCVWSSIIEIVITVMLFCSIVNNAALIVTV